MTLPHDHDIQNELLKLLAAQPEGKMHCNDVYRVLAAKFPMLTKSEIEDLYQNSLSHWANRVQFAVLHLRNQGWVLHHTMAGGKGLWAISEKGRAWLVDAPKIAEAALKELESFGKS